MTNTSALPAFLGDIHIGAGAIPANLARATATGVLWEAAAGQFLLDAPGTARFLVSEGRAVTIETRPATPSERVARFLRMAPLAALVYQRGMLACRAAAVATPKGAVLIAGVSASGKSTLAAALLKRGCHLLADEVAPVELNGDGWPVVHPTDPGIALWPDAVAHLFPTGLPSWVEPARPECPQSFTVARWNPGPPVPLCGIVHLVEYASARVGIRETSPAGRFELAIRLTWNSRFGNVLLDRGANLRIASAVARLVPVTHSVLRRLNWQADDLADAILTSAGTEAWE